MKLKNKIVIALTFLFIIYKIILANETEVCMPDQCIIDGIKSMANFKFNEAHKKFYNLYVLDSNHPSSFFYIAFLKTKMSEYYLENNNLNIIQYLNYAESLADKLLSKNSKDIDALFYKTAINALKAYSEGYKSSWWNSAQYGKEMRKYSLKILEIEPKNKDALYFIGTYNYFADIIPAIQKFIRLLLFIPGGNKKIGLEQLQIAAEEGHYTKIEAMQTLLLIYTYFEKDYIKAENYALQLIHQFPDNPFYKLVLSNCYYREKKWESCSSVLSKINNKYNHLKKRGQAAIIYEAEYWLARCYLHQYNFETSIQILNNIINEHPSKPAWLYQWSILSLAQAYDMLNYEENALIYYYKVLTIKDHRNAHAKVKWRLKNNKTLPLFYTDY